MVTVIAVARGAPVMWGALGFLLVLMCLASVLLQAARLK